jgi:hypothetical protein
MFLLYAVVAGLLLGLAVGGRPAGLAALEFRWAPLAFAGFLAQVALFAEPVSDRVGDLGPALYVASTAAVLVAVLRNVRIAGLAVVAVGAASNLAAIVANGGYMPASPVAAIAAGRTVATTYSNSAIVDGAVLAPLTDVFALPGWLPFSNVFSIGDVIIAVGVAMAIVLAMRAARQPQHGASANLPQPTAAD